MGFHEEGRHVPAREREQVVERHAHRVLEQGPETAWNVSSLFKESDPASTHTCTAWHERTKGVEPSPERPRWTT